MYSEAGKEILIKQSFLLLLHPAVYATGQRGGHSGVRSVGNHIWPGHTVRIGPGVGSQGQGWRWLETTGVLVCSAVLRDAIQAIDKIEGDKVLVSELPSFMQNMGIHLSDLEFEQAMQKVFVDGEYVRKYQCNSQIAS